MNAAPQRTTLAYAFGFLGSLLIVAWLVWVMHRYTQPAPLAEDRKAMRAKNLSELRGAEHEALTTTAWIDQPKGIVRLRIQDAMALVEREWRNPPAARSNLIARVEKATFVPPPPPAQPSPFE
jgi:uncharacterized protein YdaU (DUF1376 family)